MIILRSLNMLKDPGCDLKNRIMAQDRSIFLTSSFLRSLFFHARISPLWTAHLYTMLKDTLHTPTDMISNSHTHRYREGCIDLHCCVCGNFRSWLLDSTTYFSTMMLSHDTETRPYYFPKIITPSPNKNPKHMLHFRKKAMSPT